VINGFFCRKNYYPAGASQSVAISHSKLTFKAKQKELQPCADAAHIFSSLINAILIKFH